MKRFVLWGYKDICGKEIRCILKICSNEDYSYFMWCLKLIFCNLATVVLCKMSISVTWPWIINISLLPNFLIFVISSSAKGRLWDFWVLGRYFEKVLVLLFCRVIEWGLQRLRDSVNPAMQMMSVPGLDFRDY